ncbi:MAG: Hsp20/alpha crystallin family protein [Gammaproteobacteria bacterium]|nr:MAG: Hsp20/alpha crystallin family protein [Gammaproteobacteria bacterium]
MNVTRFEPWNMMNLLHRDLELGGARRSALAGYDDNGSSVADWLPAVDIVEEKQRFVLRADIPGVKADDIEVNMEKGVLSLSGERHQESSEEVDGMQRLERSSGKFYRRFSLPESADPDAISAKSADGILEIIIPKQERVKARKITVAAA